MKRATTGLLIGGGVAATLDIVYAFVMSTQAGISPTRVLQSVASGWLGKQAFNGGMPATVLGLLSHYGILFVAAALYLAASRRFPLWKLAQGFLSHSVLVGLPIALAIRRYSAPEVRS